MNTVIDRSKYTFSRVESNKTFKHFSGDSGFIPIACRPYRPQTKGKAEVLAKLTKRSVIVVCKLNYNKDLSPMFLFCLFAKLFKCFLHYYSY